MANTVREARQQRRLNRLNHRNYRRMVRKGKFQPLQLADYDIQFTPQVKPVVVEELPIQHWDKEGRPLGKWTRESEFTSPPKGLEIGMHPDDFAFGDVFNWYRTHRENPGPNTTFKWRGKTYTTETLEEKKARLQALAEEEARIKAEEEARIKAEEEARIKAEEEAKERLLAEQQKLMQLLKDAVRFDTEQEKLNAKVLSSLYFGKYHPYDYDELKYPKVVYDELFSEYSPYGSNGAIKFTSVPGYSVVMNELLQRALKDLYGVTDKESYKKAVKKYGNNPSKNEKLIIQYFSPLYGDTLKVNGAAMPWTVMKVLGSSAYNETINPIFIKGYRQGGRFPIFRNGGRIN